MKRLVASLRAAAVCFLALLCSGCIGFVIHDDEAHRAESPILSIDRARYFGSDGVPAKFPVPTKAHVLDAWDKPDRVETTSTADERWIYETGIRWNGVVLFLGVPIPLLIPVGFDHLAIEYAGDAVVAVETLNNAPKAGGACGFVAAHHIEFGCGSVSPQQFPGSQFLGGSRHLLPRP